MNAPHFRRRRRPQRPRAGFTVVELVMVLIIIGIMAATVMPKIRLDNTAVDTAVRSVNMSLMVAQREAVSRQHNVLLVIDTAHHTARTIWDANNNGLEDTGERTRPAPIPENVVIGRPSGVPAMGGAVEVAAEVVESGDPTIVMLRSGAANRARVIYFTSRRAIAGGDDKETRALSISRATGRPSWYRWSTSGWRRGS